VSAGANSRFQGRATVLSVIDEFDAPQFQLQSVSRATFREERIVFAGGQMHELTFVLLNSLAQRL